MYVRNKRYLPGLGLEPAGQTREVLAKGLRTLVNKVIQAGMSIPQHSSYS